MRPIAHEFAEPVPGSPELASVTLGRVIDGFEARAEFRGSLGYKIGQTAQAVAIALTLFAVLFGAGTWGLSRAERAYQLEARV